MAVTIARGLVLGRSRPEPAVLEMLRAARVLVGFPEHLALAVSSLGAEELAILGRAIQRRMIGR